MQNARRCSILPPPMLYLHPTPLRTSSLPLPYARYVHLSPNPGTSRRWGFRPTLGVLRPITHRRIWVLRPSSCRIWDFRVFKPCIPARPPAGAVSSWPCSTPAPAPPVRCSCRRSGCTGPRACRTPSWWVGRHPQRLTPRQTWSAPASGGGRSPAPCVPSRRSPEFGRSSRRTRRSTLPRALRVWCSRRHLAGRSWSSRRG
mmetsp:Transcript_22057/g.49029  ORF Transcript_22057/g.49029 Transcript_22057/m.49029 type:complete len:201 (+) Transcript_22057:192-794(+)